MPNILGSLLIFSLFSVIYTFDRPYRPCARTRYVDINDMFKCPSFSNIYAFNENVCDGKTDCPFGRDEENCSKGKSNV